jgi:hypothetical protein
MLIAKQGAPQSPLREPSSCLWLGQPERCPTNIGIRTTDGNGYGKTDSFHKFHCGDECVRHRGDFDFAYRTALGDRSVKTEISPRG